MIDIDDYKRAIQWLERGFAEQALAQNDETLRDSVTLSFELTYNLSERMLRQALSELTDDPNIAWLSSRELMRYANDEGIPLVSGESWLRYGLALEQTNQTQGDAFPDKIGQILPQYVQELQAFSKRLEQRLVQVA